MNALTDGGFICTSEHAVKVAHMISNLEACLWAEPDSMSEILDVFGGYLSGDQTEDEVMETLVQEWPKAFPGLNTEVSDDSASD